MKLIFFIACLLACIVSGSAEAWQFPKVGAEGAIEEMHQHEWLEAHKGQIYTNSALSIHVQNKYIETGVKPIDGAEDSIQISDARTGLPAEYIEIPKKPMGERYAGR